MGVREPRFLAENDPEMEAEGHGHRVEPESAGCKRQRPTGQDEDDSELRRDQWTTN